jgi:hypothetical protein
MKFQLAIIALALIASSTAVMAATNTTNSIGTPTFLLFNSTTKVVNSITGGTLHIQSPKGFNMSLTISPGTYANVSNTIYSSYNVTLSTFRTMNIPAPSNATNDIAKSAFLFQINGKIIQSVAFVNSTGAPKPVTFSVNHGANWTSWSYLNETVNGTGYVGGSYGKQNKWTYNTTSGIMSDVSLQKAQMHVYELMPGAAANYITVTTTSVASTTSVKPTTVPTTTVAAATTVATTTIKPASTILSGSSMIVIIVIIVIIIIVIIAAAMMRKKK